MRLKSSILNLGLHLKINIKYNKNTVVSSTCADGVLTQALALLYVSEAILIVWWVLFKFLIKAYA